MRNFRLVGGSALVVCLTACDSFSPTSPFYSSGATDGGRFQTTGRVIDVVSSAGIGGVMAATTEATLQTAASDATGAFTLGVDTSGSIGLPITFSGPGVVTRQTSVKIPGNAVTITAIPSSFDLIAFNELCRSSLLTGSPMLMRWTTTPPLVVETQTMLYTDIRDSDFAAISDAMSDTEYGSLTTDLTWALPQLTGGNFANFASTTRHDRTAGATITMLVSGRITVGRFVGLRAATGFSGYTRWQYGSDGVVVGGMIMLDRDVERMARSDRRAVRTHELGHALGYNHVTVRNSVMNSTAGFEPTEFDLTATRVAFLRQPGNRPPDIDPTGFTTNRVRYTWSPPIH